MRILFMPAPAIGHNFPMVPLAWALRAAGHDVSFVTAGDGLAVANAGLPVHDALPGRTGPEMLEGFAADMPQLFAPIEGPTVEAMVAEMNARKPYILAVWDPYIDVHVAIAERVRPDLIVYDPIFGVGPVAAAKLGVPAVAHAVSILRFAPELLRDLPAAVAFRRHGLTVPEGIPTIDVAPPSLVEGPASDLSVRYAAYNGGGVLPDWLLEPPQRPRIAVTLGTIVPMTSDVGYVERIADVASGIDAEFVVALGEGVPIPDGLPPNVRVTGWLPLSALLPTCSAAIHHGGDGSALTCCRYGVPQLVLPERPDDLVIAEILRSRGAARSLKLDDLDAAAIADLLGDRELRAVADDLKAEMAAMPSPADIVPRLTALVESD